MNTMQARMLHNAARPTVLCTVQRSRALQPRRQNVTVAAAAFNSPSSTESLAAEVAGKEAQLASLFGPGKVQPKAALVAGLRKEVAMLRGKLQAQLGITTPASSSSSSHARTPPSYTYGAYGGAFDYSASGASIAPSPTQKRLLDALKLAEAQLAASRQGPGSQSLSPEHQQELLQLQDENVALKSCLDAVLARQALLQALWQQHSGSSGPFGGAAGGSHTAPLSRFRSAMSGDMLGGALGKQPGRAATAGAV